jgi:hypothetical protein
VVEGETLMICSECSNGDHLRCEDNGHIRDYRDCFCQHRDRSKGWVDTSEQKAVGE